MSKTDRQHLRQHMRQLRRSLNRTQQQQAASSVDQLLSREKIFLRAKDIAFYLANDGEIDPSLLLNRAHQQGKRCYLPVLGPDHTLWFVRYQPGDKLQNNRFGIPEPIASQCRRDCWTLDLIVMPLVAFDRQGNRLGMGGGYYDRSLANIHNKPTRPVLLGLAHHHQEVESLTAENWDIPLWGVATDRELIIAH